MTAPNETCSTCRFHHAFALPKGDRVVHQCRVAAPTIHPVDGQTVWPLVASAFWCGQWTAAPSAQPERARRGPDHAAHCICVACLRSHPERWKTLKSGARSLVRAVYPVLAEALDAHEQEERNQGHVRHQPDAR